MTTQDIQQIIAKQQVLKFHQLVCENLEIGRFECDVFSAAKSGYTYEFEVKISRADFKKDTEKGMTIYRRSDFTKHSIFDLCQDDRVPNYFYYVCPVSIIKIIELPKWAGLIYIEKDGTMMEMKKAPLVHKRKMDLEPIKKKVLRLYQERKYLGCARMTYDNQKAKLKKEEWQKKQSGISTIHTMID